MGINISEIVKLKAARKSVTEYSDATKFSNSEILEQECDILIPAALENQITEKNA
jgi:glutamate dehydrogenase/leucine dehydrogenase